MAAVERVFLIILDSVGVGHLPDAYLYGDAGANTLGNISKHLLGARPENALRLPNMGRMGLGLLTDIAGTPSERPLGACLKMAERSPGKDTTTGHWEIAGVVLSKPFATYPNGFPSAVISRFEQLIGRRVIGNCPASGTEIIEELGPEHIATGYPIVYTSADSVFQIACHVDVVDLETLYGWCVAARSLFDEPSSLARVIARPFTDAMPGEVRPRYVRTADRRDFSVPPPERTLLDYTRESGVFVTGTGKIEDIFAGRGIDRSIHTVSNDDAMSKILGLIKARPPESAGTCLKRRHLVVANLVDFDSLYGHRNDPVGYARALMEFDAVLPAFLDALGERDVLIITADHGCDPTTAGTDHSREYVPVLMAGGALKPGVFLPERDSFADLGATVAELMAIKYGGKGSSFASEIIRGPADAGKDAG